MRENKSYIEWISVKSPIVSEVAFDSEECRAYVKLKKENMVFAYDNVPERIFRRFASEDCVGRCVALLGNEYSVLSVDCD
jgi:hypothetical protein